MSISSVPPVRSASPAAATWRVVPTKPKVTANAAQTSAALAAALNLPANTATAAVSETAVQISSQLGQLLQDTGKASGAELAKIKQDIQQLQQAQKQQAQLVAEKEASSSTETWSGPHLRAKV